MTKSNCDNLIDHIIPHGTSSSIRVWETPPKPGSIKRKSCILIASGFARRMDHFAGMAEYLSANGFRVFRYDSANHVGLSSGTISDFTMTEGKKSLLSVVEWIKLNGHTNIGLIAASLSARVAYEVAPDIDLSFLITAVGVVNLRDTLERAFEYDYLQHDVSDIPKVIDFEGHQINTNNFVEDCFQNNWDTFESTKYKSSQLSCPIILFTANNDNWVKESEVLEMMTNMDEEKSKLYSLIGGSHDLGENLVVLRNFYQSVTKAAITLDNGSFDIDIDINEPTFETLTEITVLERRLKGKIEKQLEELEPTEQYKANAI